jgi:hypothetical protein
MGKWQNDAMLDAALNYIKDNATKMVFCTSQPTTYSQAVSIPASSGYALADVSLGSGDVGAPANGDVSGRKITIAEKASISIDASGSGAHVAIVNDADSGALLYVTTATTQSVTSGNKLTIPAWDIEIRDAA